MSNWFCTPEDAGRLMQYYNIHNSGKGIHIHDFINLLISQFSYEGMKDPKLFTEYIDSQTHLRMEKAGMYSHHTEWNSRYGLDDNAYKCFRNITLEKFVIKSLEKISQGNDLKDGELYIDLKDI